VTRLRLSLVFLLAGVELAAGSAAAQLAKSIRLESIPAGAQVFLLQGSGRKQVCAATPCDWQADFHSDRSVLRLGFELAGHEGATLEVSPGLSHVKASLKAGENASRAPVQTARVQQLQSRLMPAIAEVVRAGEASSEVSRPSGAAGLREIDGRTYVYLPLKVWNLEPFVVDGKGSLVRAMWMSSGGGYDALLKGRLAGEGIDGTIVEATLGDPSDSVFSVAGQVDATAEVTCIPGTVMVYTSCATQAPTYETSCYNGTCSTRQSGTHCAPGNVAQYNACATRAPVTKYTVKANPRIGINPQANAGRVRLIGISHWSGSDGQGTPTWLQTDASGRAVHVAGPSPSDALKRDLGLP
jgi:hypothetical protein